MVEFICSPLHMWAEPVVLAIPGCSVPFCPFETLSALMSDVIVSEAQWKAECGVPEPIRAAQTITNSNEPVTRTGTGRLLHGDVLYIT
jgi:hypothetical protein